MYDNILNDMSLESLNYLLSVSNDQNWQDLQRKRAQYLLQFIKKNQLLNQNSSHNSKEIDDNFELFPDDLNELGQKWYAHAVPEWDDLLDEGLNPENTDILLNVLKNLKEKE